MISQNIMRFVALVLFAFVTGCSGQKSLTIPEVIQNAKTLDGKTIRVRGQAYLWIEPSQSEMWMFGGCAIDPDGSLSQRGHVVGWLTLYDQIDPDDLRLHGAPHDDTGIKISESSFHCEGNYCTMTCKSFEVVSGRNYEFVGVLRVKDGSELILENIELHRSSQLVDGKWAPISTGEFGFGFP